MKQKTLLHFWLLLCLFMAGATSAWAEDDGLFYTLTPATGTNNAYASDCDVTINGIKWNVTGNSTMTPWRLGGKSLTKVKRTVYSKTPMDSVVNKVELFIGKASGITVDTLKLVVASDESFSNVIEEIKDTCAADTTITFEPSGDVWAKGAYYKFVFCVTVSGSSNKFVEFAGAKFYAPTGDPSDTRKALKITFDDSNMSNNIAISEDLGVLIAAVTDADDNDIYGTYDELDFWWSCDEGPAYISPNYPYDEQGKFIRGFTHMIHSNEAGHSVLTIHFDGDELYKPATANYEFDVINVPYHTVTWSVNGNTTIVPDVPEGADIEFPKDPEDVEKKVFVGWATATIDGTTDEAPEFVTEAVMGEGDVTFYAVFAESSVSTDVVADSLSLGFTGVTGTTYSGWSEKKATSGAVYAGNSAGGNSAIQLRSNNGTSGIVSTTSGGRISKVFVKWNSNTADKRTLDVYGSNTAYSSASDLYDINKYGKKLGSIVNGTSTELAISDTCNYAYVGVRSNKDAMYLDSIAFTWGGGTTYSDYCTTVAADTREEAGISFAEASVTKEIVENYTGQALANPNGLVGITWKSSNKAVATVDENGALTVLAIGETIITASFDGNEDYKKATVSYTLTIQDSRKAIELAFAEESVNVNVNETVEAPELTGNTGGASVSYKSDDDDIATVDENGIVTGVADGTTTITATVEATNEYKGGTATFTVTVIDPTKPGSLSNPYTVEQAIYAIDNDGDVTDVYAKGVVSKIVTALNATYGNITYDISDDGKTSGKQLRAYRGKSYDGAKFKSAAELQVGDTVVIRGDLLYYSSGKVYEFNQDNQLVSLVRNFELNEDDGYEGTVEVTGHISIDRTIKAGTWSTIVLPYTMDELPSFITVKKFTGSTYADGCVTLNFDNATSIEANVPCMFKSDYAFSNIKPAEDKAVVVYPASELQNVETEYADMIATYAAIEELPEGVFFISNNTWYEVAENQAAHMKAFRAYFELHDIPAEARIMAIGLENEATEIKAIENGQLVIGNGAVYDLSGRRIEKPARGLYIVNGKKVLVK